MTYRDDRDADRARIQALEAELSRAKDRVAELEGRQTTALVRAEDGAIALTTRKTPSRFWLGAPLDFELRRELDGEFPVADFEDLIEPIREVYRDAGRTEILKSSMTWTSGAAPKSAGPFVTVTVTVRDGKTRIIATERLAQLAAAVHAGVGGGVGGGTIIVPIMLATTLLTPAMVPVLLGGWLGAAWLGCRALYKRVAGRRAKQLQRVFDTVVDDVTRGIEKARSAR